MQIRNPPNLISYNSDVEEESEQFLEEQINIKMMRSETLTRNSRVHIDNFRDELVKTRKEL